MTILNATIRRDFVVVSQDTWVMPKLAGLEELSALATIDVEQASEATFIGDGTPPDSQPCALGSKIIVVPHLHMLVAGSGCYATLRHWATLLMTRQVASDIRDLEQNARELIRGLRKELPHPGELLCFHAGFDREAGCYGGFVCASGDDFVPQRVEAWGHTAVPVPSSDDPAYGALAERWPRCDAPDETEAFHIELAKNQEAAWRRGLYRPGVGIGGQLHVARLDRDGLRVRVAHEFPDYALQAEISHLQNVAVLRHQIGAAISSASSA